jgi:hypothetical protein
VSVNFSTAWSHLLLPNLPLVSRLRLYFAIQFLSSILRSKNSDANHANQRELNQRKSAPFASKIRRRRTSGAEAIAVQTLPRSPVTHELREASGLRRVHRRFSTWIKPVKIHFIDFGIEIGSPRPAFVAKLCAP